MAAAAGKKKKGKRGGEHFVIDHDFVLFWRETSWPSQWFACSFQDTQGNVYGCCEQYMMAEKARLFGDAECLAQILAEPHPAKQKALGRAVRGFDDAVWCAHREDIVYNGNLLKFSQNDDLRQLLLETGARRIAEASPTDRIWGIGLGASDPAARDERQWRGANLLGNALERVRATLAAAAAASRE